MMQVIPGPGRGRQRKTETGVTERGHAWGRRDKLAVTLTIDALKLSLECGAAGGKVQP